MFFSKKQPENYLIFIPVRVIKETTETDAKITLLVPKFKNERIRRFMVPGNKSPHFRIHLDEMGSNVWRLIDDTRTVEEICTALRTKLITEEKPAEQIEERVTKYLSDLYKSRFIRFKE